MSAQKQINNWFANFEHRLNSAVPNIIAETATEYYQERFKYEDWDGQPWKPLSPNYARKKTRGAGRILTASGVMQRSIRPTTVTSGRIVISAGNSKVPYARLHNFGGRQRGTRKVRSYTNTNFMGKGKRITIKSHTRNVNYIIPKRQFIGHSNVLNQRIVTRLRTAFNQ